MELVDYSPPFEPNLDQQYDALAKGLGRAYEWAVAGRLADEPLFDAALNDRVFDRQCEEPRSDWVWSLLDAGDAIERLLPLLLERLRTLRNGDSARHVCALSLHYAERGYEEFVDPLYELVRLKPIEYDSRCGQEELIRLEGERGFLFAVEQCSSRPSDDWSFEDDQLIDTATERFGAERVERLLAQSADDAIRRFYDAWTAEKQRRAEQGKSIDRASEEIRLAQLEQVFEAARKERRVNWFIGWGRGADDADLRAVTARILAAEDPQEIANLFCIFSRRAIPDFNPALTAFARSSHDVLRLSALRGLAATSHPAIRELALEKLKQIPTELKVVELFNANFADGDERLLFERVRLTDESNERHWTMSAVLDLLEANPEAEVTPWGLAIYFLTPCSNCRVRAARLLHGRGVVPEWLRAEARHDSSEEIRKLFGDAGAE